MSTDEIDQVERFDLERVTTCQWERGEGWELLKVYIERYIEVVKVVSSRQSRVTGDGKKEKIEKELREFRFFWPPTVHFLHRLSSCVSDRAYTTVATLSTHGTDSCSTFSPCFRKLSFASFGSCYSHRDSRIDDGTSWPLSCRLEREREGN